jgi:hypothetical protein
MNKLVVVSLFGGICLAQQPGWVVIPVNEYQTLRGRAFPPDRDPETPVDATLTKVDYDLRVQSALASGRATLTVDVLKDGWVRVPIPAGLLVRESRIDGHPVALTPMPGKSGQLSAVLPHRGRSVLILDVAFPVVSTGGEERLSLPAGSSGVTRAAISLNASPDLDVRVSGGFMSEKTASHWLAYARGTEPLLFTWRKKMEERRTELPLRMRGSLTQLFGLGEDSSSLNAEVQIDVQQGSAAQVKISVPPSVTINQVPGATVADWDVKNGELTVNFLEPVERSARFAISAECHLPRDGSIGIPLLGLSGSEREAGGVAVEVLGAGEIKDTKAQGLEVVEAAELGAMVANRQSPSLAAFRIRPGAAVRSLDVQVARYAQQAVLTANIEEARYRVLASVDGKLLVQARYAVRNNQRSFLKVTLPAGATVWSSSVAGRPVRAGVGPDNSLLFPLSKSRAGEEAPVFAVEVLYLARSTAWELKGRSSVTLPVLDLPVSRTGLILYYPPAYRATVETGAFRTQPFEQASSEVLNGTAAILPSANTVSGLPASSTQALVDSYRARSNARRTGDSLPAGLSFPAVGPSLFVVSELSVENKAAVVNLDYQKDKKGGVQ